MPATMKDLLSLLELEAIEQLIFRGDAPETTLQRLFGGQVLAQALVAAGRTVTAERAPHSLHGYFLRPGDTSVPIVYVVERLLDGRSFSTRGVVARQRGVPIFHLTASFQAHEDGLSHQDEMPSARHPETLPEFSEWLAQRTDGVGPKEWAALDIRYDNDFQGNLGLRTWFRTIGPLPQSQLLQSAVLAYASDLNLLAAAALREGLHMGEGKLIAVSIDHAMWFHRSARVDEWLLHDQESPSASGGRGLGRGRVFSLDGRLVATTVQEGLLRRRRDSD